MENSIHQGEEPPKHRKEKQKEPECYDSRNDQISQICFLKSKKIVCLRHILKQHFMIL